MKTTAIRLYGKNDLRLEQFELPATGPNEILATVVSDSICMSTYKAAIQGEDHKRVPNDIAENPTIVGHEFCGTILEVGENLRDQFQPGSKYSIQPALNYPGRELEAPGYSFHNIGGNATRILIPGEVTEMKCLLPYTGEGFFKASLSEPVSCIIGAFNSSYHYKQGEYEHKMGIQEGGRMLILAGAGPMGLGAIDYAVHGPRKPALLVVTDIDQPRLDRAASIFTPEDAKQFGVDLRYVNTSTGNAVEDLAAISDGKGYDDVFVYAPVAPLIEQASKLLGFNGCLNFFAGPSKSDFSATINFYDVHYSGHHVVGSSGGNTADMIEALDLMSRDILNPAVMITHIGGMDCAIETVLNLPKIPGGKKLIYTNVRMPLTALDDLAEKGKVCPFCRDLAVILARNNGLWCVEAEDYLLAHAPKLEEE
jgi:threonine dehydrogenase-like Zn-dependent dehydrogenase